MRRLSLYATLVLAALPAVAHSATAIPLKTYVERSLLKCPTSSVDVTPVTDRKGPSGFKAYKVKLQSLDKRCSDETYALVSTTTNQILVANVTQLPRDARPLIQKITDMGKQMLRKPVRVSIDPSPLPDGIRRVQVSTDTSQGVMSYGAYLDSSQEFLMVGRRGDLTVNPSKTLLDLIGASNGAKRGSKTAAISIVEVSDFQCPTCRRAHDFMEPLINKNLGKISYTRLDMPLFEHHDWALPAAMMSRALARTAPAKYWAFVDYMFQNQEQIKAHNVEQVMKNFLEDNDIAWKSVQSVYSSSSERAQLLRQLGHIYDAGVFATPTYIVNGQMIYYGDDGAHVKGYVESLLKPAAVKSKAKKGAGKKK